MELINPTNLSDDRASNSRMLLEVPGLSDTVSLQLGSAIFIPALNDEDNTYHCLNIDIDDKPMQIFKPKSADRASLKVYPGQAFDYVGTSHLFRYSGIPIVYKQMIINLVLFHRDLSLLEVAFNPDEVKLLTPGITHNLHYADNVGQN